MHYICHRVNNAETLKEFSQNYGAEIDLRDGLDGRIYLEHDPFTAGEDFETYLQSYHNGTLILNVKSERIEEKAISLLEKAKIDDYFFLDSSFPMIYLLSQKGITKTALRFSEYEGLDTIRAMRGRAEWVWADCFSKCPLTYENAMEIKSLGFKICIVSPELQGRPQDITEMAEYLLNEQIIPDAVCTKVKYIPIWKKYFD